MRQGCQSPEGKYERGGDLTKVTLTVPDISCEHCEHAITETLAPQPGVRTVSVDIPTRKVNLEFDETQINLDKVGELLDEEGYPIESVVPA